MAGKAQSPRHAQGARPGRRGYEYQRPKGNDLAGAPDPGSHVPGRAGCAPCDPPIPGRLAGNSTTYHGDLFHISRRSLPSTSSTSHQGRDRRDMWLLLARAVKQVREKRSSLWPRVRRDWLKDHSTCAACGTRKKLEVHHIVPFSHDPSRELDPTNLITLCEYRQCHLRFGHSWDWKAAHPHVVTDAAAALLRIAGRIYRSIVPSDQQAA